MKRKWKYSAVASIAALWGTANAAPPIPSQVGTYTGKGAATFFYPNSAKTAKVQSNITVIVFESGEVRLQLPAAPGTPDPIVMNVVAFFDNKSAYLSNQFSASIPKDMAGSILFTQSGASTSANLNMTLADTNGAYLGFDVDAKKLIKTTGVNR